MDVTWKTARGTHTIVADARSGDGEVDTGLEDGGAAGVTVNAHPSGRGVRSRATGRLLGGRDREGCSDSLVCSLGESDTVSSTRSSYSGNRALLTLLATRTAPAQLLL